MQTELYHFKEFVLPEFKCLDISLQTATIKKESTIATTNFVTQKTVIYGE